MAENNDRTSQLPDANPHLTPEIKIKIYQILAESNRAFGSVTATCEELEKTEVFDPQVISDLRGLNWELQAEFNTYILSGLLDAERGDAFKYGQVRLERNRRNEED
jgi:hypothetical protein